MEYKGAHNFVGSSLNLGGYTEGVTSFTGSGTLNFDVAASGSVYDINMDGDTTINLLSNLSGGQALSVTAVLTHQVANVTVSWGAEINWPNAAAPTLSAASGDVDVLSFISKDYGVTWYGFPAGLKF